MADEVVNLKKLKVADLKKELADRGLPTKGNKKELQARLEECLAAQGVVVSQDESEITDDQEAEDELDNDTDDLEDVDVGEDVPEPDVDINVLEEQTKDKDLIAKESKENTMVNQEQPNPGSKKVPVRPPGPVSHSDALTEEEKKSQRLKRFGQSPPSSDDNKKQARAQRFGLSGSATNNVSKKDVPLAAADGVNVDKLKKRAERFGAVSPVMTKIEESDRLLKRKQRFGVAVTSSLGDSMATKKKKRAERFGI